MHCPPFGTQNVSTLVGPHFRMHPSLPLPTSKPVTRVTRQHQTSPTTPENYGFPKTDVTVTSVTIPFRFLLPSGGKRGCRYPEGDLGAHSFFIYCANPFLLFPLFSLKNPASHSPALSPSAPRRQRQGVSSNRGSVDKPLDSPPTPVIIARPHTHARAR
nr:MAG TPA: hypothetical protein [Caudoviricetes sp.]